MTFTKNVCISFFVISLFLSDSSVAMVEEPDDPKPCISPQRSSPKGIPIGSILPFAGESAPDGWLMCHGQRCTSLKYPELYEVIKTKYVPDNERWILESNKHATVEKFFHIPDMRGRVTIGVDGVAGRVTSRNALGGSGGEEKPSLNYIIKVDDVVLTNLIEKPASLSNYNEEINNKINLLIRESENLSRKVNTLHERLNSSKPVKAKFEHSSRVWTPYTNTNWGLVTFDLFEGDERLRGNLSTIEIPEDGVYSLFAGYCWKANAKGVAMPSTAISIDKPGNVICHVQHHLAPGFSEKSILNRVIHLNKGNKVMVSIFGQPNAEHFLGCFKLEIEKLY